MVRQHVPSGACVTRLALGVSYGKAAPQSTLTSVLQARQEGARGFAMAAEAARLRQVLPQLQAEGDADLALAMRLQQEELARVGAPARATKKAKTLAAYWGVASKKSKTNE